MSALTYMRTYSGVKFHPLDPSPEEIMIEDIAHGLSNLCRFVGQVRSFYSVAQHSYQVSILCTRPMALWGLLHDAPEAYLADLPRPIKHHRDFRMYREAEDRLMTAICYKFGLVGTEKPPEVEVLDTKMLATEQRDLMPEFEEDLVATPIVGYTIDPWPAFVAERKFLEEFYAIDRRR